MSFTEKGIQSVRMNPNSGFPLGICPSMTGRPKPLNLLPLAQCQDYSPTEIGEVDSLGEHPASWKTKVRFGPQVAVIEPTETGALKSWTPQGETAVDGTPVELVNTLRKTVQNKPRGCGVCSVCFLSMAIGWTPGRVESWRGSSLGLTLSGSKEHSCKKSPFLWITQIGSPLFAGVSQRTFTDQVRARPDRSSLR